MICQFWHQDIRNDRKHFIENFKWLIIHKINSAAKIDIHFQGQSILIVVVISFFCWSKTSIMYINIASKPTKWAISFDSFIAFCRKDHIFKLILVNMNWFFDNQLFSVLWINIWLMCLKVYDDMYILNIRRRRIWLVIRKRAWIKKWYVL